MQAVRLQLALPFPHDPTYDARDFIPAVSNHNALAWLERVVDWPDRRLALWGQAGCGKSHLLHLWAERVGAVRLAGQTLGGLQDLPATGAVAMDDADTVALDTTLLHVLNTARDRGLIVLMTSRLPPAHWPVRLPDLSSRLRAITSTEIEAPDDDLLRTMLLRLLADRQLQVSQTVQDWLLRRLPRAPAALREAVARLDRASLVCGKAITRSLAASLLAAEDDCDNDQLC
ncbi:HdaA/DnaA family protein [Rhodopila sp.]|uniref:HdaA/DnaA family protein n=1 Tax=Rhodopila sp. TaxID=2480087 RepID=UPI003D12F691